MQIKLSSIHPVQQTTARPANQFTFKGTDYVPAEIEYKGSYAVDGLHAPEAVCVRMLSSVGSEGSSLVVSATSEGLWVRRWDAEGRITDERLLNATEGARFRDAIGAQFGMHLPTDLKLIKDSLMPLVGHGEVSAGDVADI
jgi:hypothetical protein